MTSKTNTSPGWLATALGIDLRSLALFRVVLASVVLGYLLVRLPHTTAFLTDAGVVPRDALVKLGADGRFSLYLANGQWWFAALLQFLTLACALGLWFGYRSRLMAVSLFILFASLVSRNPLVNTGGDYLLCALLFWGMFLPLNARWSCDAALSTRAPPSDNQHVSVPSAALVFHSLAMLLAGAALNGGGTWPLAVLPAIPILFRGRMWDWATERMDHGRRLRLYYDRDCGFCRKSCLLLRHFLVLPRTELEVAQDHARPRRLMENNFTWVAIDDDDVAHTKWNVMVALLRHSLLFRWVAPLAGLGIWERPGNAVYDWVAKNRDRFGELATILFPPRAEAFEPSRAAQRAAGTMMVVVLVGYASAAGLTPGVIQRLSEPVLQSFALDRSWTAFAPGPARPDTWAVFPGRLDDGTRVDVLRPGRTLSWAQPEQQPLASANANWQALLWRLSDPAYDTQRRHYAAHACRQWNRDPDRGHLIRFEMVYVEAKGSATPERNVLSQYDCETAS